MQNQIVSFIFVCVFSTGLVAQNTAPVDSTIYFQATFFQNRIPDFVKGFKNRKPFQTEQTARIFTGHHQATVELFWKRDSLGKSEYFLITSFPDNTTNLIPLPSDKLDNDQSVAKLAIRLSSDKPEKSPLELCILHSSNILLFRWIDSSKHSGLAEGLPSVKTYPISLGSHLPAFIASSLTGDTVDIAKFNGRIIVINTWEIGCSGCIAEMPGLNKLVQKHINQDIEFIAIASNSLSELVPYLNRNTFTFQQLVHNERTDSLFSTDEGWPRNIIVNKSGIVVYNFLGGGEKTYLELDKEIEKILEAGK